MLRRIGKGLRHPRQGLAYVLVGKVKFELLYGPKPWEIHRFNMITRETCFIWKPVGTLEEHMTGVTDIHEHLATLHMFTVEHDFRGVLELGTSMGESTIALLLAVRRIGGHVTSIDMNPCLEARQAVERLGLSVNWTFKQGDDLQVEWREPIDLLLIDTSHKYEHTLKELEKFEPHVREGGMILMHDIVSFPEVNNAMTQYVKGRNDLRPYRYLNNNGLGIIFKGGSRIVPSEQPRVSDSRS